MKVIDFPKRFTADLPVEKKSFITSHSTFETPSTKIFLYFLLNQKNLCEIIFRYHNKYF